MKLRVIRAGRWTVLTRVGEDDRSPLLDFLNGLEGKLAPDALRVARLFQALADQGSIRNERKSRAIEGAKGIFELKGDLVRVFYFNHEGCRIVCSHGVLKPKKKQVLTEAKKAEKLREELQKADREGNLVILGE